MKQLVSLAFTHKNLTLDQVGELHVPIDNYSGFFEQLKSVLQYEEVFYLSTCNRVEFVFVFPSQFKAHDIAQKVLSNFDCKNQPELIMDGVEYYLGNDVVKHLISVASSVESLIVGEREIITQVRNAFENCRNHKLCGDTIRLLIRSVIETAKKVYANTLISENPVSIVSLTFRELKKLNPNKDDRILMIGAGVTNTNFCRFLVKYGFNNIVVFNRTLENAKKLVRETGGLAKSLDEINSYTDGFDILISCTSSDEEIITQKIYQGLTQNETSKKIIIDLAIPKDISSEVIEKNSVHYFSIDQMKIISEKNLKIRKKELVKAFEIIDSGVLLFAKMQKERNVELAMKEVPKQVKKIRQFAINSLYKDDLKKLNEDERELVDKVIGYMEKKYISGPMKLAKEIILSEIRDNDL